MCGIAGLLSLDRSAAPKQAELRAMIQSLHHRGPDASGIHISGDCGLAHARLSIIDLHTGDQPMSNEDGTIWVVFNGEIFNYLELRKTLQGRGHQFRTSSDTETIVHAYEEYGDAFVAHLNGQFAVALWDDNQRRLVLARDRAGIRPLFYAERNGRLAFASEVKALKPVLPGGLSLDPESVAQVFSLWSNVDQRTPFHGIHSLPPGHVLTIDQGRTSLQRYWSWSPTSDAMPESGSVADTTEALRELLIDAVRLQLRADVPVGAYLSGGLDSSGIVALIRNFSNTPVRTFSVTFGDAEFDESRHQQTMIKHLETEHTSIHCQTTDIGTLFPRLIEQIETPILRTAPVPLMMLSELAHNSGLKVVLTGEGADEVFGGYDLFKEAQIRRFWARQPQSTSRPQLLTRLYPYLKHSPVAQAGMATVFYGHDLGSVTDAFYSHRPRWRTGSRLWRFFNADLRSSLGNFDPSSDLASSLPANFDHWRPVQRDQFVEAQTLLAGYLLSSQGDRVSMANSVESRYPFLDHRVIQFGMNLRDRFKIRGLREKAILREALRPLLPETIVERSKQPYRAPDSQSFFVNGRPLDYVQDLLSSEKVRDQGLFDPQAVQRLFEKCRTGKAIGFSDNMAFVGILSTQLLAESIA